MWRRKKHIVKPHQRSTPAAAAESKQAAEQEVAQTDAPDKDSAVQSVPPYFKGDPEHLAKLKEGVEAWNKWRDENPSIRPNLLGADFTRMEDFLGTPIWGSSRWDPNGPGRALLGGTNLSGAMLWHAKLSGSILSDANLNGAHLRYANLSGAVLVGANLSGANLRYANLSGADLVGANLSGAYLGSTNLSSANLWEANLNGAVLSLTNLADANVSSISYDPKLLRNHCRGIRAETCYGDAQFKRLVMDQGYLDQIEDRISCTKGHEIGRFREAMKWWPDALLDGFVKWPALLAGGALGLLLSLVLLHHVHDHAHRMANLLAAPALDWPFTLALLLGGAAVAGFFAGTAGKLLIFKLWGLFDYGRSWAAVLVFAVAIIFFVGLGYYCWDGVHVALSGEVRSHPVWFFPWFVAAMGFATLGISSYATPLDSVGALLMMANVLSGFLTLGLLLSVLGNIFARRA